MSSELKINELKTDTKNFNKGSQKGAELIKTSFSKFGAGRSILIDKNNNIIAGNKSTEECIRQGIHDVIIVETDGTKLVAVKRTDVDLDTPEGRELALADNATAKENIVWMEDLIAEVVGVEVAEAWGVKLDTNYSDQDDAYVVPDEISTTIQSGDLIEIGPHRLLCGDSRLIDNWRKLCGSQKLDLIVTDPPYNVDYHGGTEEALSIKNDNMSSDAFYQFLLDFHTSIAKVTKPGASYYVFHSDTEGHNFRRAFISSANHLAQCLIWAKNSIVMGRQDYHWQHEPILYGWKEGSGHSWYADRTQSTILNFDRPTRNEKHPTIKPVPLISYLITNSSKPGDIVGDGFLGSGTTMVSSHMLGRICYGNEDDPRFCQVIVERMHELDPSLPITKNGQPWNPTEQPF